MSGATSKISADYKLTQPKPDTTDTPDTPDTRQMHVESCGAYKGKANTLEMQRLMSAQTQNSHDENLIQLIQLIYMVHTKCM